MQKFLIVLALASGVLAGCRVDKDFAPTTDLKPLESEQIGKAQGQASHHGHRR